MINGQIDQDPLLIDERLVMVDAELVFSEKIVFKFKILPIKRFYFSEVNKFVINSIKRNQYDNNYQIIVVGNKKRLHKITDIVRKYVSSFVHIFSFNKEEEYKEFLQLRNPMVHLSIPERRNYCKTSALIDDNVIKGVI